MRIRLARTRRFVLSRVVKNVFAIVTLFLIFDALVVVFGGYYLVENLRSFFGKSGIVVCSDLLFLEGGIIFAFGAFVAAMEAIREMKPSPNPSTRKLLALNQLVAHCSTRVALMMIVDAILIGLAVVAGMLLI